MMEEVKKTEKAGEGRSTTTTRARLILKCFLSRDQELLYKAYCVYVRLKLLEYYSSVVAAPQDSGG